jgi:hypothetical protein
MRTSATFVNWLMAKSVLIESQDSAVSAGASDLKQAAPDRNDLRHAFDHWPQLAHKVLDGEIYCRFRFPLNSKRGVRFPKLWRSLTTFFSHSTTMGSHEFTG